MPLPTKIPSQTHVPITLSEKAGLPSANVPSTPPSSVPAGVHVTLGHEDIAVGGHAVLENRLRRENEPRVVLGHVETARSGVGGGDCQGRQRGRGEERLGVNVCLLMNFG